VAQIIKTTTIGFDFVFDIAEDNGAGAAAVSPSSPLPSGFDIKPGNLTLQRQGTGNSFTLGLMGGAATHRHNARRFRIIEDLKVLKNAPCPPEAVAANWAYPITGATGVGEVVRTFIKLETLADLQPDIPPTDVPFPSAFGFSGSEQVVFSDVLQFTTTLTGSATPTWTLSPASPAVGRLQVTSASITGFAQRMDTHNVIVAIARDPKNVIVRPGRSSERVSPRVASAAANNPAKARRIELIQTNAIADSRIVAALVQKDAPAHDRVLIELQRLRDLEDDAREAPRLLGERLLEIMRTP